MEEQQEALAPLPSPTPSGRPWLASRLLQRQVVNVSTLEQVGRIADVLFDPSNSQLAGVVIQRDHAPTGVRTMIDRLMRRATELGVVPLDHVVSLNGDVVMVDAEPRRLDRSGAFEGALSLNDVCDLVILTTYGMSLGSLADLLLGDLGCTVSGYVVRPTELAVSSLPLIADLTGTLVEVATTDSEQTASAEDAEGLEGAEGLESVEGAADAEGTAALAESALRVIPASAHVRFGESMILLVSEVEPLSRRVVVVAPEVAQQTDTASVLRNLKKQWMA